MNTETSLFDGGCTCRFVRYRIASRPLFVHCCHCRWCQRETGTSFALNALVETDRVGLLEGEVHVVNTPSKSSKSQRISRCPRCRVAVWSNYHGAGDAVTFIRVGTLDEPDRLPPDIHIYVQSKQPWVVLPPGAPEVAEYYKASEYWPRRASIVEPPSSHTHISNSKLVLFLDKMAMNRSAGKAPSRRCPLSSIVRRTTAKS